MSGGNFSGGSFSGAVGGFSVDADTTFVQKGAERAVDQSFFNIETPAEEAELMAAIAAVLPYIFKRKRKPH